MFDELDTDHDGLIDIDELMNAKDGKKKEKDHSLVNYEQFRKKYHPKVCSWIILKA